MPRTDNPSNGYDALAEEFIVSRAVHVGVATVRGWSRALPAGATVLDLGCGSGVPVSSTLMDEGLIVYGLDASPRMVAAFRSRFPRARSRVRR